MELIEDKPEDLADAPSDNQAPYGPIDDADGPDGPVDDTNGPADGPADDADGPSEAEEMYMGNQLGDRTITGYLSPAGAVDVPDVAAEEFDDSGSMYDNAGEIEDEESGPASDAEPEPVRKPRKVSPMGIGFILAANHKL